MKHNELLEIMTEAVEDSLEYEWDKKGWSALLALVQLHQDFNNVCEWCTCRDCDHIVDYPCKTIQTIEKKLF
jgi:hypothetical protein